MKINERITRYVKWLEINFIFPDKKILEEMDKKPNFLEITFLRIDDGLPLKLTVN